jgi:hypothetical protein
MHKSEPESRQPQLRALPSATPPFDQGKSNLAGTRYIGYGVIIGYQRTDDDNVPDMVHLIRSGASTEYYASAMMF